MAITHKITSKTTIKCTYCSKRWEVDSSKNFVLPLCKEHLHKRRNYFVEMVDADIRLNRK